MPFGISCSLAATQALAANECGAAVSGATVTCNGDGTPASDTGNFAGGISYTVPVNLIVDGTVNPITSGGRIGVTSSAGAQSTTLLGTVNITRVNPGAGVVGVGDTSSHTRDISLNIGPDVTITTTSTSARNLYGVGAQAVNSAINIVSYADVIISTPTGAAARGYSLADGTGGANASLNATIGGLIDIDSTGGTAIYGLIARMSGAGSAQTVTVDSSATVNIDITGTQTGEASADGLIAQNFNADVHVRSTGAITVNADNLSFARGIETSSSNGDILVETSADIAVNIATLGTATGVYANATNGKATFDIQADVSAISGGEKNSYALYTAGAANDITVGDGVSLYSESQGAFTAYGIRAGGTTGGTFNIGENSSLSAVANNSSAYTLYSLSGLYDVTIGEGATINATSYSPSSSSTAYAYAIAMRGTDGGTLRLERDATITTSAQLGRYALSMSSGNDVVISYGDLFGDSYGNAGNDTFSFLGGSIHGLVSMDAGDDALNITDMDTAGLQDISSLNGGIGTDTLTFTNIDYMGSSMAVDDLSLGINLLNSWETINFVNTDWTLTGNLVLGGSTVNIDPTSTLYAGGGINSVISSVIPGDPAIVNNAGTIDLTNGGTGATDTLTILGDYVGQGGTILMNVMANGTTSASDRLIIDGSNGGGAISGSTILTIVPTDLGAPTQNNGILLIQTINGATTASNAFTLSNPRISSGAYDYMLTLNSGNSNWYLVSTPGARDEIVTDITLPALSHRLGLAMLGRLDERQNEGDTRFWVRSFGQFGQLGGTGNFAAHGPGYDYTVAGMQIGMDLYRSPAEEKTRNIVGVYTGAGHAMADAAAVDGSNAGRSDMTGYGIGAYWTHHAAAGWYTDTAVQANLYTSAGARSDAGVSIGTQGHGYLASVETGIERRIRKDLTVTPQLQLTAQTVTLDDADDSFGGIDFREARAVHSRAGVKIAKSFDSEDGPFQAWIMPGMTHSFGGEAQTIVTDAGGTNPNSFRTDLGGTALLLNTGVSAKFSENTAFFAEAGYSVSVDRPGNALAGKIGMKVSW